MRNNKIGYAAMVLALLLMAAALLTGCGGNGATDPAQTTPGVSPSPAGVSPDAEGGASPSPSPSPPPQVTLDIKESDLPLRLKDDKAAVKVLQQALKTLGYIDQEQTTTYFGTVTEAAVKAFQTACGIEADGVVGSKTLEAIVSALNSGGAPVETTDDDDDDAGGTAEVQPLSRLDGLTVAVDAAHQAKADAGEEPVAPGADAVVQKGTAGYSGADAGAPEYELTLEVALKLKAKLEALGAKVVLTRSDAQAKLSGGERAEIANQAGADALVVLDAAGSNDALDGGAFALVAAPAGYVSAALEESGGRLGRLLLEEMVGATGASSRGVGYRSDQTIINWAQAPAGILSLGYVTNPEEDALLRSAAYQQKIVDGVARGLLRFFAQPGPGA